MSTIEQKTLSELFVKGIDYGTEEWCKQLLQTVTSKKLYNVSPFVGVVRFPSDEFYDYNLNLHQTRQFQTSMYVGLMEFLLPKNASTSGSPSFSKVHFDLDGVTRTFINIIGGNTVDGTGQKFQDFILHQYPNANDDFVFNKTAMHYLTNIQVNGSEYELSGGVFTPVTVGSFNPSIRFEINVSGYQCQLT